MRKIRINGERASVALNIDELMEPIKNFIIEKKIPACDIYNMDQTGLFYREMPNSTLAKISDDGAGVKEDKSRITVLFSVNGDGSKKNIYLIGKSKTPKGVNKKFFDEKNVEYFSNSSAWMDREIFTKIISEMDRNLNTPTIVIIDNFSGHKLTEPEKLKNIILVFLPPNTSKTQPLDLRIISAFKFKFQKFSLSCL